MCIRDSLIPDPETRRIITIDINRDADAPNGDTPIDFSELDKLAQKRGFESWSAMNQHYIQYGEGAAPDATKARRDYTRELPPDPSATSQETKPRTLVTSGIYTLPSGNFRVVEPDGTTQDFDKKHYDRDYLQRAYRGRPYSFLGVFPGKE